MSAPGTQAARPVLGPCLVAAGLLALGELATSGWPASGMTWVILALFAGLGVGVAAAWRAAAWLVAVGGHGGLRASALLATPSLLVTLPATRRMFDGAFAATLPGSAWGQYWAPLIGLAATAATLHAGRWAAARRPRAVGALVVLCGLVLDGINRRVKTSELPDLHAALIVAEVVAVAAGLALLAPERRLRIRARVVVILACVTAAAVAVAGGLRDAEDRRALATSGYHGRLLVRAVRGALDGDGDGHAQVLGGLDCDDADATVHPGAPDRTRDGVDQDCDGQDGPTDTTTLLAPPPETLAAREQWYASTPVREALAGTRRHDVVLLTVDTLRADLLTDSPGARERYPNTFALLDASRRFDRAFAPSAGTDLSMSGLLTGRINPFEGVELTLAEAMHASGRRTLAVIPSETLRYVGKSVLTRGLDQHRRVINDLHEEDVGSYTTSHRTVDLALRMIDEHAAAHGEQPLFLWAHMFDLHEHHEIEGSDRRLRDAIGDRASRDWAERYRQTYQLVDQEIGRLVAGLEERGRWERTILVFTSDHGESLHDDPRLPDNHGLVLYQGLVHVPFAIRVPGVRPGAVDAPMSLVDAFPTLLELVGQDVPRMADGRSMLPHVLGPEAAPAVTAGIHPIPLHESDQVGVVVWPHKLLVRPGEGIVELFDLESDPGETRDLAAEQPERVRQLRAVQAAFPTVALDRTRRGRRQREQATRAGPSG